MNASLLSLLNLEALYEAQGWLGVRNRKFNSSKVKGRPGRLCAAVAEGLAARTIAEIRLAPAIKPITPANDNAQIACARPWTKTPGRVENSIKPKTPSTMAVSTSPNMARLSRPHTAVSSGDVPALCTRPPTAAAARNASSMNIRASAHFVLVVGRREMDQHFTAPARNAIQTNAWPVMRPASVGVTAANQSNRISFVTKLMRSSARSKRRSETGQRYPESRHGLRQA